MKTLLWFLVLAAGSSAQSLPANYAAHFDYDKRAPLNVKENGTTTRDTIRIVDLTYDSPRGGLVPAYLLVPPGKGPFPAIVYAHWRNAERSPKTSNRTEFLDEALVYAKAGTVCLLIDGAFARPGFKSNPDPFSSQEADVLTQQVLDLRRAIDLLQSRKDVARTKIGYVGHSYDAMVGGILRAVEPRFTTLVLMAGSYSTRAELQSDDPDTLAFRKQYGDERINKYLDENEWMDPVHYVTLSGKAPVLLQNATHDEFESETVSALTAEAVGAPKAVKWYDAKHALNAEARLDRYIWLRKYLGLNDISNQSLMRVPALQ